MTVEPLNLVSRSGGKIPLRALPYDRLNADFWSRGLTVYDHERRESPSIEKPIDTMSLDDLIATQNSNPLSESRRSFLATGSGVLSLDRQQVDHEGEIGTLAEFVADDSPLRSWPQYAEPEVDLELSDNHNALRYGVPYETVDPITTRQIEWEQNQARNSAVTRLRVQATEDGRTALARVGKGFATPESLVAAMRSAKRSLVQTFGPIDTFIGHEAQIARVRALLDATVRPDFLVPDADEEERRLNEPADLEWHTAYERVVPQAIIQIAEDGSETIVGHQRVVRLMHRSELRSKDEFWHHRLFDPSEFELGTHGLVSALVTQP